MIDIKDYEELDAVALAQGIREKRFSACEVMNCAISKAESLNPQLNAISWQTYEQALARAIELDNAQTNNTTPLAGVPFLFKDISAVKGLPQTNQSALFSGETADNNAAIVESFNHAGLISIGKSNTPEFCLTITTEPAAGTTCHNPWHLDYSTGGSSGGAAAAVAARIVPVAHATDGGGSIRVPASCCGVLGLKPSRGLTPVQSKVGASWSGLSVGHIVSRSVRDSAAVLDAIKLNNPLLYPLPPGPDSFLAGLGTLPNLTVAVQRDHPFGATVHPEVARAVDIAADICKDLGFDVRDAVPPIDYRQLTGFSGNIINTHVAQSVFPQLEKRGVSIDTDKLEEGTRRMAKRGAKVTATEYLAAIDGIREMSNQMSAFHETYDILISPVISQPPAKLGWLNMNADDFKTYIERFRDYSGFCSLANATGQPSMSVPLHLSDEGLPIGVMLTAKWGADLTLLQLAERLEQTVNWGSRTPEIC